MNRDLRLYTSQYGTFLLDPEDFVSKHIANGGYWDDGLKPIIEKYAPGKHCIDVGAHVGFMSVQMMKAGAAGVLALEPQDTLFVQLQVTSLLNGDGRISPLKMAAYDETGLSLSFAAVQGWNTNDPEWRRHSSGSIAFALTTDEAKENPIETITLDDLNWEGGVGLIKIDAQGADLRVMKGAQHTMRSDRPAVIFEWEHDLSERLNGDRWEDYCSFLDSVGYGWEDLGQGGNFLALPKEQG